MFIYKLVNIQNAEVMKIVMDKPMYQEIWDKYLDMGWRVYPIT